MRIVIVDDDPLVVSALTTIVGNSNYEVIATGTSGFDAVKLYKKTSSGFVNDRYTYAGEIRT